MPVMIAAAKSLSRASPNCLLCGCGWKPGEGVRRRGRPSASVRQERPPLPAEGEVLQCLCSACVSIPFEDGNFRIGPGKVALLEKDCRNWFTSVRRARWRHCSISAWDLVDEPVACSARRIGTRVWRRAGRRAQLTLGWRWCWLASARSSRQPPRPPTRAH